MSLKVEKGNILSEYGLIIGLVALLAIPAITYLGLTHHQLLGFIGLGADSSNSSWNGYQSLISAKPQSHQPGSQKVTQAAANPGPAVTAQTAGAQGSLLSGITLDPKSGQLILNLPGAGGAGSNVTSVEGQLNQAPAATDLLANQMLALANQLQADPHADPQLLSLIRNMAADGADLSSNQKGYITTNNDGICYSCNHDLIQLGQDYQQAAARLAALSSDSSYNYAALNAQLTQLTAVTSKVYAQNFLDAPVVSAVNCKDCPAAPPGTTLVALMNNPNTLDIRNGDVANPQQMLNQINSTLALFNTVNIDTAMINRTLAPPVTLAASQAIGASGNQYQKQQPVAAGAAQQILNQATAP